MKKTAFFLVALTLLLAFPNLSPAVTEDEIIESVKKEPVVRQKFLEVTLPADRRVTLDDREKTIDEMIKTSEVFLVPLGSQCGVAGCGGSKLVVIRHSRRGTNASSRYVAALVRIMNAKIRKISLAKISPDDEMAGVGDGLKSKDIEK